MRQVPKLHVAGLLLVLLTITSLAYADSTADLKQAEKLSNQRQYMQVEQLYEKILAEADDAQAQGKSVDADLMFTVHKKLPILYLATDQLDQAKASFEALLEKHGDRDDLAHALHEIVEEAKKINKTSQAGQVCSDILAAHPGGQDALWLKMGVALANVYLRDDRAVNSAVQSIVANYGGDPWAAEALAQTGWAYDKIEEYDKSKPIYEYIVDTWPQKSRTIHAHTALVRVCIFLRDDQAAKTRLQQLIERYAKEDELPGVLVQICRNYREAQMFDESQQVSRYVLENFPKDGSCIWAQRDLVLCDIGKGDDEEAEGGVEKLVASYGDSGHLPYVLNEIAAGYRQSGVYDKARAISQWVLTNRPESDQCIWVQCNIVLCDIAQGAEQAATEGIETLKTRFGDHGGLIWALADSATAYSGKGQHERARELFAYNVENHPNKDDSIWCLRDYIKESLFLGDTVATDAGIEKLLADYGDSVNFPMAAVHTGRELLEADHPKAAEVLQAVVDKYPDDDQAMIAKVGFGQIKLRQGQDAEAEAIYAKVLADYADDPQLAEVVHVMAEGYFLRAFQPTVRGDISLTEELSDGTKAYLLKAVEKWEYIATKIPVDAEITPRAYYFLATAYHRLGDPAKAVQYASQLVERWPDHDMGWRAQHLIVKVYKRQIPDDQSIEESAAVEAMIEAARQLVEKYPACRVASTARKYLAQFDVSKQGGEK